MRLFLAIPLPEAIRDEAAALGRRLALDAAAWRQASPAGLHLTLRFLGEVDPERAARDMAAWRAAVRAFPPIPLEVRGCGAFPHARRPRIVWIAVRDRSEAGALAVLAAAIERAARMLGYPPEPRPFVPHVTLARARPRSASRPLALEEEAALGAFRADAVVLFRSVLSASGARYLVEATFALEGA